MNQNQPAIIVFAPHLDYPTRNGADIYVDRIACHLSKYQGRVLVLGKRTLTEYVRGSEESQVAFANKARPKLVAALRTILFRSHYLYEKFITPAFTRKSEELMKKFPASACFYSFIFTSRLDRSNERSFILTHNDEVAYYRHQRDHSRHPARKLVSAISIKTAKKNIKAIPGRSILVHINEADQKGYEEFIPNERNLVLPAGVDEYPFIAPPAWDGRFRLVFCGSLSVRMNLDALQYFSDEFFPPLQVSFKNRLEIHVAGSSPAKAVVDLCRENGWTIYPNIPDDKLRNLYSRAAFGILPFPYTTGAKIKLLNFLAAGLPVLATANMLNLPHQNFSPNLYSNNGVEWLEHLKKYQKVGISVEDRLRCRKYAHRYGWDSIAREFNQKLSRLIKK